MISILIAFKYTFEQLEKTLSSIDGCSSFVNEVIISYDSSIDRSFMDSIMAGRSYVKIIECRRAGIYPALNVGNSLVNSSHVLVLGAGDVIKIVGNRDEIYLDPRSFYSIQELDRSGGGHANVAICYNARQPDRYFLRGAPKHPLTLIPRTFVLRFDYREDFKIISDYIYMRKMIESNDYGCHKLANFFVEIDRSGISSVESHKSTHLSELVKFSMQSRDYLPASVALIALFRHKLRALLIRRNKNRSENY
jgi:hypothetical protein